MKDAGTAPLNGGVGSHVLPTPVKTLIISICLVLLFSNTGYSTIRYVKAGNPTPVYPYTSWATASDSIQKVVDMCESGDTIIIGTGIYRETVVSEHPGRDLAILGVDVDSCIVDLRNFPLLNTFYAFRVRDNLVLENMTIKTSQSSTLHRAVWIDVINGIAKVRIRFNKISGSFYKSLTIWSCFGEISNNIITSAEIALETSYSSGDSTLQIHDNLITKSAYGLNVNNGIFKNNLIFLSDMTGVYLNIIGGSTASFFNNLISQGRPGATGIMYARGKIVNNIINKHEIAILSYTPLTPLNLVNNSFDSCTNIFSLFQDGKLNGMINYNNFYGYGTISNDISKLDPDTLIYTTVDPMYEGTDSSNYRLQMYSPLIDAGDPTILDVDGTRSDIGRYGGPYGQRYEYLDLAPKVPRFSTVTKKPTGVVLQWRGGTEADFNSFSLHRGREAGFIPDETNRIYTGVDTLFSDSLADPTGSYTYKLKAKDNQGNVSKLDSVTVVMTGLAGETAPTPERIFLYQNYPNPFNPSTKIKFSLDSEAEVILRVYDVNGREVAVLQRGMLPAGEYEREFSPVTTGTMSDLSSGVYFYNLLVRDKDLKPLFIKTEKMMFLK